MKNYDHKKIEKKLQTEWEKSKVYQAKNNSKKKKFYSLIEFPYPSGAGLHVGHPRPYIAMDVVSRKKRMEGYNVLFPIGWDAFGLPTENYAIKTGIHPAKVTKQNSDNFRRQIKMFGPSFDWSREINTTDPAYYKWTQWIFLQMYKKGLAYKAEIPINWCPNDKIGLANEEVVDGKCERCGAQTERRLKNQWMLAITKYADRLDKDLDLVDYSERIKTQQRNWIGRSEGSEIEFKTNINRNIKVFTTRADTLFGATYVVLSPEHISIGEFLVQSTNMAEISQYIREVKNKPDIERTAENKEKTGVELKGVKAINPANNEEIPVWVADYVLANYGTGAVMAVPAHDERDFEFAKKYGLEIRKVIEPLVVREEGLDSVKKDLPFSERRAVVCIIKHWAEEKYLMSFYKKNGWKGFIVGGLEGSETPENAGIREIEEETGYKNAKFVNDLGIVHSKFFHQVKDVNRFAHFEVAYFKLENGEQIETSDEEKGLHDIVWLSADEVSKAINREDIKIAWDFFNGKMCFTGDGILINSGKFSGFNSEEARKKITDFSGSKIVTKYKLRDWVFSRQRYWGEPIPLVNCKKCGIVPISEKELPLKLPEVKSYKLTDTGESPLASIKKWVNTKCPKCKGKATRETDTMPNWAGSSWYYLRYVDPKNKKEFANKKLLKYWTPVDWYNGGMEHVTLHLLYSRFWHKFLYDLKLVPTKEPYKKRTAHGMILAEGGEKMSKSKGNVVNPDDIIKTYGADTLRVYEMFIGPFGDTVVWNTESIIGPRRFIEKVWRIGEKISKENTSLVSLEKILHKTIKKVGEDIEGMHFNTAISAMMILATEMEKVEKVFKEDFKKFLQILAPFAPHVAEEIWQNLGEKKSIHISGWPKYDKKLIKDDEVKIAIQVNGKVRAEIMIGTDETEEKIKDKAIKNEQVIKFTEGKEIRKVIYVKNRLVNVVV